ncbi:MAG: hypothetical protein LKK13_05690 [Bacilli bacterium]|jgi:hypothetical protein|nr:hypothetical protein [Bacilli bacterium]
MHFKKSIDGLPHIVKIVLAIVPFLDLVFVVARLVYDVENKKAIPLILDILCFFGLGVLTWIMDIVDTIFANRIFLWEDWIA